MENKKGKDDNQNLLAALAYIIPFANIILYVLKRNENKYISFHALQSILYSVALVVLNIALTIVGAILSTVVPFAGLCLLPILPLLFLVFLFLAYKAWKGEKYSLPIIGEWAEKYA